MGEAHYHKVQGLSIYQNSQVSSFSLSGISMAGLSLKTSLRLVQNQPSTQPPPLFLIPSLTYTANYRQRAPFSSSAPRCRRFKDNNKARGVSALRRTGLKYPVAMSKEPLPQPVLDPKKRRKVVGDPNHGLWGFFNKQRTALTKPEDESAHGECNLLQGTPCAC